MFSSTHRKNSVEIEKFQPDVDTDHDQCFIPLALSLFFCIINHISLLILIKISGGLAPIVGCDFRRDRCDARSSRERCEARTEARFTSGPS
jgi:hypothetical protein